MQFPRKNKLLIFCVVLLFVFVGMACSGSRIYNKYDKSGPSSVYTSPSPYKTQYVRIYKDEKESVKEKPIILIEEEKTGQLPKVTTYKAEEQIKILKVGDRYILIKVKSGGD